VQARRASNGLILKNAVEMIADSADILKKDPSSDNQNFHPHQPGALELISLFNQIQAKTEEKAVSAAASSQSSMALMMQTMMQSQQQAQQQFQQMLLEMNKQSQVQQQSQQTLLTTLLTTMLSKKEEKTGGIDMLTVMKMVKDAESSTETRTKNWFELVEKKAELLASEKAELMADREDGGEESVTKSVIKGFMPVIAQLMAGQQQQQQQIAQNPQQRVQILAPNPSMPQSLSPKAPPAGAQSAGPARPAQPKYFESAEQDANSNVQQIRPVVALKTEKLKESPKLTEENKMKDQITELVKMDIAQSFILKKSATKTAEACLKKLEKKGILRQDVNNAFTLQDFFELASQYGVLDKAKPWITEFYEALVEKPTLPNNGISSRAQTRQLT
jgi:hypothetical protein